MLDFKIPELTAPETFDLYLRLHAIRACEKDAAKRAIRINDYLEYGSCKFNFLEMNAILSKFFEDDKIAEFPECPEKMPSFEEDQPVVFSDGSSVETADVPF